MPKVIEMALRFVGWAVFVFLVWEYLFRKFGLDEKLAPLLGLGMVVMGVTDTLSYLGLIKTDKTIAIVEWGLLPGYLELLINALIITAVIVIGVGFLLGLESAFHEEKKLFSEEDMIGKTKERR